MPRYKPAVAAVAIALLGAACGGGASDTEDLGVVHVHGLGVDPGDGVLYAATHYGVFRIPDDDGAVRVADRYQDTMGFTVVGPHRFLASGHPPLDDKRLQVEGKPPLLGLIESTDGAETWDSLSLLGDADFHGLVAAHGLVYGYDSTGRRFMVTSDRRRWDTRSQIELVSFAVSPSNGEQIVATARTGVVQSADGGRTWAPIAGAPGLLWLSWDKSALWGVAPEGALWRSADGAAWSQAGTVPGSEPQALLAVDEELYVATRSGIHQSDNGGKEWRIRYRDPRAPSR